MPSDQIHILSKSEMLTIRKCEVLHWLNSASARKTGVGTWKIWKTFQMCRYQGILYFNVVQGIVIYNTAWCTHISCWNSDCWHSDSIPVVVGIVS